MSDPCSPTQSALLGRIGASHRRADDGSEGVPVALLGCADFSILSIKDGGGVDQVSVTRDDTMDHRALSMCECISDVTPPLCFKDAGGWPGYTTILSRCTKSAGNDNP